MSDLIGTSSSFPSSLDQFSIKKPFDPSISLSSQQTHALERPEHFNHMFDAIYNIESHILSGGGGAGGQIVTRYSSGGATSSIDHPQVKLNYSYLNVSITGNTTTVTAMVPSSFSSLPFMSPGFSMSHTFYLNSPGGSALLKGTWANKTYGDDGPFNSTIGWFQFFTMIRPLTGRVFEATIKNLPYHSTSQSISNTFTDSMIFINSNSGATQDLWNRSGWTGSGVKGLFVKVTGIEPLWRGLCEESNNKRYGWAYATNLGIVSNGYVEWGEINNRYATPETGNECYTRLGPMIRASGTLTNATFYCVAIGDIPRTAGLSGDKGKYGRILKVVGANLSNEGPATSDGGGTSWPSGVVGYLSHPTSGSSGYFWFGDSSTRYRLQCSTTGGSAFISILSSPSPYSTWNTIYGPFIDASSPLLSGYMGFFSQAMNGDDNRWVEFKGSVVASNSSSTTSLSGTIEFLFMEVTPSNELTFGAG